MSKYRLLLLLIVTLLGACGRTPAADVPAEPATALQPTAAQATSMQPTTDTEAYPGPDMVVSPAAVDAYPAPEMAEAYPAPGEAGFGDVPWAADGVIASGEYAHQATIGQVTLYWSNDTDYLYLAAEAETAGWLGVGLDPQNQMQGADFIIAAAEGDALAVNDAYGQAPVGATHPQDATIGGSDDLLASAALQQDGWMRLEVQKPLDSGDAYDRVLQPGGTYKVLVATGTDAQYNSRHSFRAAGEITLD
ncbi:MAG: DOMON domain-containing protein [Anaerolineae bacterium]